MTTNKKSTAIKKPLKIPRRRVQIDMDATQSEILDTLSTEMDMTHRQLLIAAMMLILAIKKRTGKGEKLAFIKNGKATEVELVGPFSGSEVLIDRGATTGVNMKE